MKRTLLYGTNWYCDAHLQQLAAILKAVPNGKGLRILYWAAEFLPLPGTNLAQVDGSSFFDDTGNALPVTKAFGQLAQAPEKPEKAP